MGDLGVTALYTSATWRWGSLANAELVAHPEAARVFRVVNAALAIAHPFGEAGFAPLRVALLHRHAAIDAIVAASGSRRVLELAAGLSRRGITMSAEPSVEYVEVDRAAVLETKRGLLGRTPAGRAALARPNLRLVAADVTEVVLDDLCPPDGRRLAVIAEGLLMYLGVEEQLALARRVAQRLARDGGLFVFDYVPPREQPPPGPAGRALGWVMKRFTGGEGFAPDERSRGEVVSDLAACGFSEVEAIEPRVVARAWGLPYPDAVTRQLLFVARV